MPAEPISKVQRWLDLIAYLVGRRLPISVEDLLEGLPAYARDWKEGDDTARASVRRKFERDKDELRAMGIPIETVPYTVGFGREAMEGYRISRRDFYLPYLRLLAEEGADGEKSTGKGAAADGEKSTREGAAAGGGKSTGKGAAAGGEGSGPPAPRRPTGGVEVREAGVEFSRSDAAAAVHGLRSLSLLPAFPLAGAARSALRKFTFDLDPEAFGDAPVLFAVPPDTARSVESMRLLSDALQKRKVVTFLYHGIHRGEATRRQVRPYALLFQHSHWYLVGWDEDRQAERLFRVDRMEAVEKNAERPHTPDFEAPEDDVLERYRGREAWELGEADETLVARAWFRFPTSLWAERNGYGSRLEEASDGSSLREFEVRQPHAFLRWILSLEGEADIASPPELREGLRAMAREVAALYEGVGNA
jgi:proteasome accessory factor B